MPSRTNPPRRYLSLFAAGLILAAPLLMGQQPTLATTVPLILPGGLAYDAQGNLYFAETGNHVVRRVTPAGVITTVAGTGGQGYSGDGGLATAALLDSPSSVALDSSADIFIADAHNHRIRRVDAVSGIITTFVGIGTAGLSANGTLASAAQIDLPSALAFDSSGNLYFADQRRHVILRVDHATSLLSTVAGNGTQGYSGNLLLATLASIDSPAGIAFDTSGNLYLADTHNQRIRRVDAVTGMITTVAGTGQPGFSGDGASASAASLNLPRGLILDASGNLYLADSRNQRIRQIDAASGQIATIAGDGTQAFAGDSNPAVSASLDTPRAVTLSPANLPTLADTANQRVRQVNSSSIISTIAGIGVTTAGTLTLTGPAVATYGSGTLTVTLAATPATGSITFFDTASGATRTLATIPLESNIATLSIASLATGVQSLTATYPGDASHAAAQSGTLSLTVSPAPLLATPNSVSLLYGQSIPGLTGSLTGVLAQDSALVSLTLTSPAAALSAPAAYPITAAISGAAAGNYALTQTPAAVNIAPAPSAITLSDALAVHVASTTSGVPAGTVNLLDAASVYASAILSPTGDAAFSSANLSTGTHTLTAVYLGDADFVGIASSPIIATIGTVAAPDFTLAASGQASTTVLAGTAAAFSFTVAPVNGGLSSPILLTVSGLPAGAAAAFNPTYLPPSNAPASFTLTIQTPQTASIAHINLLIFAMLLPLTICLRKRKPRAILATLLIAATMGCGNRVNSAAANAASVSYNITVIGTATATSGGTVQHTATVTLILQ